MKIKLAILEHDKNYLSRIITAFNNRYSDKLQVYSFTKTDEIMYETIKESKIDVLIASDYFEIEHSKLPNSCAFAYFVETSGIEEYNGKKTICKYQKASAIYKGILNVFSEVAANISGVKITEESDTKVVAFTSVSGGTGSSTAAVAYAKYLAQKGYKPLFLNFEILGNTNVFFKGNGQFGFTDVIYALKSKKTNLAMKLESCVKQDESGVYFYDPCSVPLDMLEMSKEEIVNIINVLRFTNTYTHLVIDIDFAFDDKTIEIFESSTDIVVVADGSEISNSKFENFHKTLLILEKQRDIRLVDKLRVLYNRFSSKFSKEIQIEELNVIGGIPKYENATTQQIVDQIKGLNVFSSIT